ncbi:hypothetical protein C4J81_03245 [Deltaproteobacteria bacterium Smac51]|nr:hypothetical protein C4J81_03245 [Deltaproteobacteria bacterium Smac51]
MRSGNPGLVLAFTSTLCYCFLNIGIRIMVADLSMWGILILRGAVALVIAGAAAAFLKRSLFTNNNKLLLLAIGTCSYLSSLCTIKAISLIPLYQALVLLYLYPAITVPLGYVINGDKVTGRDCLYVGLAFVGCLILVWPDSSAGLSFGIGHVGGICTCFFYAMSFVLARKLGDNNDGGIQPLFYFGVSAVIGTALSVLLFDFNTGINETTILPGLGLGFLAVTALLTSYAALRWLVPFKVGIIGTLEVFGGAIASWLMFNDPITARALVGGLIILVVALKLRQS